MLKPSWLRKKEWALSLWLLNFKIFQNTSNNLWGMYCRNILVPNFALPFKNFSIKRIFSHKNTNVSPLAHAWVRFSESKGCNLNQLYSALSGGNKKLTNLDNDPIGLLNDNYNISVKYEEESEEWLINEMKHSLIYQNRINSLVELIYRWGVERDKISGNKVQLMIFEIFYVNYDLRRSGIFPHIALRILLIPIMLPVYLLNLFLNSNTLIILLITLKVLMPMAISVTEDKFDVIFVFQLLFLAQIEASRGCSSFQVTEEFYRHLKLGRTKYEKTLDKHINRFSEEEGVSVNMIKNEVKQLSEYLGWDIEKSLLP
jgi:hypothetical protein